MVIAMFVGVARVTLQIPDSGSLKAKRQILRRVTDRVKARFNASVAEVDDNDLWQRATIAMAVVGNDQRHVNEQLEKILHFVDEMYVAPMISRELEIIPLGVRLFTEPSQPAHAQVPAWMRPQEDLSLQIPKGDRSLAEAEGMADWERRHEGGEEEEAASEPVRPSYREPGRAKELSLDEARARARALRNPREWEKP